MSTPTLLITGAAGFIGAALAKRLLDGPYRLVGLDNHNDYYDPQLKEDRIAPLLADARYTHQRMDLADRAGMERLFADYQPDLVVNLAAQAGVRYSLSNPHAYADANLTGFLNVLEGCRQQQVKHLIYASSSSVYGLNRSMPYRTQHNVDHPVSLYAASKKANELMAHAYSHLYQIPSTGLRFFTVYGPWGRPDMAYFSFTRKLLAGEPIDVFNHGNCQRDFTYIDDIVEGIVRLLKAPEPTANPTWQHNPEDPLNTPAPYRLYNIGNHQPVSLLRFIEILEGLTGCRAQKNLLPMQPGDVEATYADIDPLHQAVGFHPDTTLEDGLQRFMDWYRTYYS